MKFVKIVLCLLVLAALPVVIRIHAQGTNRYINRPSATGTPSAGTATVPGRPTATTTVTSRPTGGSSTTPRTFRELTNTETFYFKADTNRTFLWIKTTEYTGKNTVNGSQAVIPSQTPVTQ